MIRQPRNSSFKEAHNWYLEQISRNEPNLLYASNLTIRQIQNDVQQSGMLYPFASSCL